MLRPGAGESSSLDGFQPQAAGSCGKRERLDVEFPEEEGGGGMGEGRWGREGAA